MRLTSGRNFGNDVAYGNIDHILDGKVKFPCYKCENIGEETPRCDKYIQCLRWRTWAKQKGIPFDEK